MASVVSLLGSWGMQGMLPEEVTFETVLQKEICQAGQKGATYANAPHFVAGLEWRAKRGR